MRAAALLAGLVGALLAPAGLAQDGDPAAGKVAAGLCRTCHGLNGFARIPIAPHIGGEHPSYIRHQLTAFREGQRVHEIMSVVAASLTDEQIADLAAWFSSQTIHVALKPGLGPGDAPEACALCHGAEGVAVLEDAPNLAGESAIYIETQLKAFRTGRRVHEIMSPIAADLTDEEIRAAADWYAAVRLTIDPPR
ncbi:c-type cytochrome [Cereibacter sphaeroides]|uniref:c-type cytochrome n=1 Tax=Rhodobacterales TaxID=204455 RepID=UPI000BBE8F4D|nr:MULTISPECIES: c-type cytochrome [Paracoccaceae]MCE6952704.1 c-type cytochrome [Cereibacter sphaeroides]